MLIKIKLICIENRLASINNDLRMSIKYKQSNWPLHLIWNEEKIAFDIENQCMRWHSITPTLQPILDWIRLESGGNSFQLFRHCTASHSVPCVFVCGSRKYSVFSCDFAISKLNYKNVVRMIDIQRHALLSTCSAPFSQAFVRLSLSLAVCLSSVSKRNRSTSVARSLSHCRFHIFSFFASLPSCVSVECDAVALIRCAFVFPF